MSESFSIAIPCRADEPALSITLESLAMACQWSHLSQEHVVELLVCINGVKKEQECVPLVAVRKFCHEHQMGCTEVWLTNDGRPMRNVELPEKRIPAPNWQAKVERGLDSDFIQATASNGPKDTRTTPFPSCTVLLTERRGKPPAWNILWRWAKGDLVLFTDADVWIDPAAVFYLYTCLRQGPMLQLVAAREVPAAVERETLWSRMAAISYRFNFGNAGGRLFLIRKTALKDGLPEDLLLEDAWLTVAVGRTSVYKETRARVFFLPPATRGDYFAERVRTEGGKLQIQRQYPTLLTQGPIARYRWCEFWRDLRVTEYPLVALSLFIRLLARGWAWTQIRHRDFYSLYRPFTSTKQWK